MNLSELTSKTPGAGLESDPWARGGFVNVTTPTCSGAVDAQLGNRTSACRPSEKNWAALLILAVIAVTVMGNILVILAVSLEKKLQNATNYFLMSLAAADMLLGILVMPVSMVTILFSLGLSHSGDGGGQDLIQTGVL